MGQSLRLAGGQSERDQEYGPSHHRLNGRSRPEITERVTSQKEEPTRPGADPELGGGNRDELIWVVAVSGNYGLSPSFGCCSVPRDYPGYNTSGLATFVDGLGMAHADEIEVSYHGDWPPFFDQLPDLATA
jgi:hypothetical protein